MVERKVKKNDERRLNHFLLALKFVCAFRVSASRASSRIQKQDFIREDFELGKKVVDSV